MDLIPAIVAAAVLAAMPATAAAASRTRTVIIDKMKFGALPTDLRVGDVILWVNKDLFRHTATARDHSFNVDLVPASKGRTVIKHSGEIAFSCTYHPGMKGRLIVGRR